MDDLQEAEALETALDALGGSPTTAQILEVLKATTVMRVWRPR